MKHAPLVRLEDESREEFHERCDAHEEFEEMYARREAQRLNPPAWLPKHVHA